MALIVGTAAVGGPLLKDRMQNRRLDTLARQQQEAIAKLSAIEQQAKAIEQLADGSLTAAYRAELAAVEAQLVAMRKPSADTMAAIQVTEARLIAMRRALADREAALAMSKAASEAQPQQYI